MAQSNERTVNLKVEIPQSVDRALEKAVLGASSTKRALVEVALRQFLKLPERAA